MENTIIYYYNIVPEKIIKTEKNYRIFTKEKNFLFAEITRSREEIMELSEINKELYNLGFPIHKFIHNINEQIITVYNDKFYCLMEIICVDKIVDINDILFFNVMIKEFKSLTRINWLELWSSKIDFYEEQIKEIGVKYPSIKKSFSYFIGLSENAVSLIKNANIEELYLTNKRISQKYTTIDLYSPLNFVIDSKSRNICEYLKNNFRHEKNIYNKTIEYIENYLTKSETIYFFSRLLFPTYYFDLIEHANELNKMDREIEKIEIEIENYEIYLRNIYIYLRSNNIINNINWLEKKHLN